MRLFIRKSLSGKNENESSEGKNEIENGNKILEFSRMRV